MPGHSVVAWADGFAYFRKGRSDERSLAFALPGSSEPTKSHDQMAIPATSSWIRGAKRATDRLSTLLQASLATTTGL